MSAIVWCRECGIRESYDSPEDANERAKEHSETIHGEDPENRAWNRMADKAMRLEMIKRRVAMHFIRPSGAAQKVLEEVRVILEGTPDAVFHMVKGSTNGATAGRGRKPETRDRGGRRPNRSRLDAVVEGPDGDESEASGMVQGLDGDVLGGRSDGQAADG